MNTKHLVAGLALVGLLPFLQGCVVTSTALAVQAVPMMVGGVAMANLPDRSPFNSSVQYVGPRSDDQLEQLTVWLNQAECGDAQSQFEVASALRTGFNSNPDWIEIYKWYLLSDAQAYPPAGEALRGLNGQISRQEVEMARARASAWQPRTENCTLPS